MAFLSNALYTAFLSLHIVRSRPRSRVNSQGAEPSRFCGVLASFSQSRPETVRGVYVIVAMLFLMMLVLCLLRLSQHQHIGETLHSFLSQIHIDRNTFSFSSRCTQSLISLITCGLPRISVILAGHVIVLAVPLNIMVCCSQASSSFSPCRTKIGVLMI